MSDDKSRLARVEEDVKNICRSLDEMKEDARNREKKLDEILVQATRTNGRVNELERHRDTVCRVNSEGLEAVKKRMWLFAGLMVGSGAAGGVAGAELLKLLVGG